MGRPGIQKWKGRAHRKWDTGLEINAMKVYPHFDRREQSRAVSTFLAGLPDFRRGRIVTASSDLDSWKRKHPAIVRRLAQTWASR